MLIVDERHHAWLIAWNLYMMRARIGKSGFLRGAEEVIEVLFDNDEPDALNSNLTPLSDRASLISIDHSPLHSCWWVIGLVHFLAMSWLQHTLVRGDAVAEIYVETTVAVPIVIWRVRGWLTKDTLVYLLFLGNSVGLFSGEGCSSGKSLQKVDYYQSIYKTL